MLSHIILSKAEVNSSSSSHFTSLGPPVNTVTYKKTEKALPMVAIDQFAQWDMDQIITPRICAKYW